MVNFYIYVCIADFCIWIKVLYTRIRTIGIYFIYIVIVMYLFYNYTIAYRINKLRIYTVINLYFFMQDSFIVDINF